MSFIISIYFIFLCVTFFWTFLDLEIHFLTLSLSNGFCNVLKWFITLKSYTAINQWKTNTITDEKNIKPCLELFFVGVCIFSRFFFYQLFGCPKTNFESLTTLPHSCYSLRIIYFDPKVTGSLVIRMLLKAGRAHQSDLNREPSDSEYRQYHTV